VQARRGGKRPPTAQLRSSCRGGAPPNGASSALLAAWSGCVDIILSSCDSGLCCNVVSIVSGGGAPPNGASSALFAVWSGCADIILSSCDSGLCCNVVSIVSGGGGGGGCAQRRHVDPPSILTEGKNLRRSGMGCVCGCVWVCVGVCGCVWVCVGVCGCVWVCVGVCGC
jgi:hypothetical protein